MAVTLEWQFTTLRYFMQTDDGATGHNIIMQLQKVKWDFRFPSTTYSSAYYRGHLFLVLVNSKVYGKLCSCGLNKCVYNKKYISNQCVYGHIRQAVQPQTC